MYSIFGIGRREGMAIGFYSFSAIIGTAIGTAISPVIKNNKENGTLKKTVSIIMKVAVFLKKLLLIICGIIL